MSPPGGSDIRRKRNGVSKEFRPKKSALVDGRLRRRRSELSAAHSACESHPFAFFGLLACPDPWCTVWHSIAASFSHIDDDKAHASTST